jgi:hypothetical protein
MSDQTPPPLTLLIEAVKPVESQATVSTAVDKQNRPVKGYALIPDLPEPPLRPVLPG